MNAWNPEANAIFLDALEAPSAEERRAFLDRACSGNSELRARVEALLVASEQAGSFLNEPAVAISPTVDEASVSERPGTIIGQYKLLQQIGEGGMGVVWMAEQELPVRRKVALKIIKPGLDSRQVSARFEAERQVLALMDHHNIAKVFDGGTTESGRPYFVMELIHGVPITQYCDDNQLTPRERMELFVPVCQAIQHAHQKGIIHRDIKPSNVLVTLYDGKPVPKIIDFGVAKAIEQRLTEQTLFTQYGTIIGTFEYMSPEQAEMSALGVDTRSDIYSLGVLLYELLTGTTPLERQRLRTVSYPEIVRLIREEEPLRPSTLLSSSKSLPAVAAARKTEPAKLAKLFRGELDWIVMKALEKDRNRRYESASSMAADVERYLHDESVLACPPSAAYRLHKFARRNKAELAIAGLVLFFLVLIGGGVGWTVRDSAAREADLARIREARRRKLNLEIEHALEDAAKGRELALKLTDNPYAWEASLAESLSDLKRAKGLAAQDETDLEPAILERLQALQTLLSADEADRRFAARFEEIRLEQTEVNVAISEFKAQVAFTALKEAFQGQYHIAFGLTPVEQAVTILQQRPNGVQDFLLAALELSLDDAPKEDRHVRPWLTAVLDAVDTGPWRKRAQQAVGAKDWKALEQLIEEAVTARQPPSLLLRLARMIPTTSSIRIPVAQRIRRAYPGDFWANHDLATLLHYRRSPQLEESIRCYYAALALRPGNPAECVNLGNALAAGGDLVGAIRSYREAIGGHPDYTAAHIKLGEALLLQNKRDEAFAEYTRAIELDPKNPWCWQMRGWAYKDLPQYDKALADLNKAIELDQKRAELWNDRGYTYYLLHQYDKAIVDFNEAIDLAPKWKVPWRNRGMVYYDLHQYDKAIADDSEAIKLNPKWEVPWVERGTVYLDLHQYDKAIADDSEAIKLNPKMGEAWHNRGVAYHRLHQYDKAIADYSEAIKLDPKWQNTWHSRGVAYHRLHQDDKAIADYSEAIKLDPRNVDSWFWRARSYYDLHQYDKAIADMNKVIELDSKFASGHNGLAWYLATCPAANSRDPPRAVELAKKAVELAPTEGNFWNTLGVAFYRAGDWQAALHALKKSMALQKGGNCHDWFFLAMAHWQLGEREKARQWFDKAVEWMDKNMPKDQELGRFRAEAAELLRIEAKKR
jgi:tetratricopeptide (TPR) repeat protein/serine/threonine protein kinase